MATKTKQNESKPEETETNEKDPARVMWPMMADETIQMVSEWMKNKHGVAGTDFLTNVPKGITRVSFLPVTK